MKNKQHQTIKQELLEVFENSEKVNKPISKEMLEAAYPDFKKEVMEVIFKMVRDGLLYEPIKDHFRRTK